MLNIEKNIENGTAAYTLEGRLDTTTAPELEQSLKESLNGIGAMTMDLAKLEYISSAGLRVLLMAQKTMNGHGELKILHVPDAIMEIFEVTGFTDILTIE